MDKAGAIQQFMQDMNRAGIKTRIIYPDALPGVMVTKLISESDIRKATRLPVETKVSRGEMYCVLDVTCQKTI